MKTCGRCRVREVCGRLCPGVEGLLPKELTGKDAHREINMGAEAFMAAAERRSYSRWSCSETASGGRPDIDLSALAPREKRAVLLIMSGLTQREAASRMKISRLTLRTLIGRAVKKLRVAQGSHLVETKNGGMG